jgi:hypothetical protein
MRPLRRMHIGENMFDSILNADSFGMEAADGTADDLNVRYRRHSLAADVTSGRIQAWHIAAARGLYRLMCDIEIAGGPVVGMGMPHLLCVTDEEVRQCAR